jgi:putative endopeptidase
MKIRYAFLLPAFASLTLAMNDASAQTASRKYIDPANMDTTVKAGDDFYRFANGNWLKNNPIPATETRWGSNNVLIDFTRTAIRKLLTDAAANAKAAPGSVEKRVGDFYFAATDSATIEKLGYTPIAADLARVATIKSKQDVLSEIAYVRTVGLSAPLFGFTVSPDPKNVNRSLPFLGQGGTSLPDRENYLRTDARSLRIQEAYKKYIVRLFTLTGVAAPTAQAYADTVFNMEKTLAAAQMSRQELRDPYKRYNKLTLDAFSKVAPGIDWKSMLAKMKVPNQDTVLVTIPKFFTEAAALVNNRSVEDWKTYLTWHLLRSAAPYLSNDFVQANFAFSQVLTGQKALLPRAERMATLTNSSIGELLGQLYVKYNFTPEAKARTLEMVNNFRKAYERRIKNLDWMSDSTKLKALDKLHAMVAKIAYPDKWENYEGLAINRNTFFDNVKNENAWDYNKSIQRVGKPIDRTEWNMTPATVNASYSPLTNDITFPAGYLQFPWFDAKADDAVNYGAIGGVIGHEMSHGFDDQGSQFDKVGNLSNWWTPEDQAKFKAKTKALVEQYNTYTVLDTLHVNGAFTLGENIGDLGGLNVAYEAFQMTKQSKSNQKIDGLTPDQRFFLAWAQIRKSAMRPETAAQSILTDPHSPSEYRAVGPVVNMDAWYKAFNVQPGDKLYKKPEERIKIW